MPRDRRRRDAAEIALAAPTVERRVAVQRFFPDAAPGNAQPMILAWHGCEVARDQHRLVGAAAAAEEGERALLRVVAVDPLEARRVAVVLVERGLGAVERVQVADPALE